MLAARPEPSTTLSLALASSLLALTACSGTSLPTGFATDAGTTSTGSGSGTDPGNPGPVDSGGAPIFSTNGGDAGASTACSAASQLVYVLSSTNAIYSFDPQSKAFTKVSTLQCQAGAMTPNSMAVDREGNAWVNYVSANPVTGEPSAGSVFKVDIATGTCAATNIKLTSGWYQLGMGFSTVSATDTTDTLYVAATNSGGLGCIGGGGPGLPGGGGAGSSAGLGFLDTDAGTLTQVGPFTGDLAGQSGELTGTGDGRLFGFFVGSPVKVAQISKSSGATSNEVSMTGVPCPTAWAFSFWGGDFYMYTSPDGTTPSSVTHYTTGDGGIDTSYVANVGFVIVGAGVSTCAPTTTPPPK